jgi:uncharacterized surface protein with fasciclin (FAS1) repeats
MKNLVGTAIDAGSFKTLVTAVKEAGLVDTLSGKGPFTVFAPTDKAFDKLPRGTVESLLKDKGKLTEILTYHVVPGEVTSSQVKKMKSARTVQGKKLKIRHFWNTKVNNAKIVNPDIHASNGIIHVIDNVLIPS